MKTLQLGSLEINLVHPARMAIAVMLALLAAKGLGLPEVYWASIAALIVIQSDPSASLLTSCLLLAGTALGACAGALLATCIGAGAVACALGVLVVGLFAATLRFDRRVSQFAAIALVIVLLTGPSDRAWDRALHRFAEFSTGIVMALLLSVLWPERQTRPAESTVKSAEQNNQQKS